MNKIYRFGKFTLKADEQTLYSEIGAVHLPTKEFEILQLFVENNGKILTKDEMMKAIWADTFVEESNLSQYISRLRKILNIEGQQFIKTFSKRGYRFSAEMEISENNLIERHEVGLETKKDFQLSPKSLGEINNLAILPFKKLGLQTDDDFLGLGITDALITQLTRTREILVRPTTAIQKYAGSTKTVQEIAAELDVDAILQGNFQIIDNRLRLNVQMLESNRETPIWAEVFDVELKDIFAVQDEIVEKIVGSLSQIISDDLFNNFKNRQIQNVEAYQEYLKGRFYFTKREVEGLKKALIHYEKAIELEPLYAAAFAGMAEVYAMLPLFDEIPPDFAFPRARAATLKALEIDQNLVEAHISLGICLLNYDWNWKGAEVSFLRAIGLNPNYAPGHQVFATFLLRLGRVTDAIIELKKAQLLDPLSPVINTWLAEAYSYLGDYELSIRLHQQTINFSPDFFLAYYHLSLTYLLDDQFDKAIKTSKKALSLSHKISLTQFAFAFLQAIIGETEGAYKILENLIEKRKEKYVSPVNIASCFAALGNIEMTLQWLDIGLKERDPNLTWIKIDKEFVLLRNDPKFLTILKRINLTD